MGTHLEGVDDDVRCVCVQLLLGTLLVVAPPYKYPTKVSADIHPSKTVILTLKLYTYPMRHALDAALPQRLVELGVDADVGGAHGLLRELDDALDGLGRPLLERGAVHTLVQVDGVFAGDDVLEGRARLAGL